MSRGWPQNGYFSVLPFCRTNISRQLLSTGAVRFRAEVSVSEQAKTCVVADFTLNINRLVVPGFGGRTACMLNAYFIP